MKKTGMVRRLDDLRRLCIPVEICRKLHLHEKDPVEFFLDGDMICARKYDGAGDLEQVLEDVEKTIRLNDCLILDDKVDTLLGKVKEMRKILGEVEHRAF